MEPYSKKNFQVKHGKSGSIMPLHYPLEAIITRSYPCDKRTPLPRPEIYPQNWSAQYLVVRLLKFHKRGNFFSLIKN